MAQKAHNVPKGPESPIIPPPKPLQQSKGNHHPNLLQNKNCFVIDSFALHHVMYMVLHGSALLFIEVHAVFCCKADAVLELLECELVAKINSHYIRPDDQHKV